MGVGVPAAPDPVGVLDPAGVFAWDPVGRPYGRPANSMWGRLPRPLRCL